MFNPRNDFERFIEETLLQEFLDLELSQAAFDIKGKKGAGSIPKPAPGASKKKGKMDVLASKETSANKKKMDLVGTSDAMKKMLNVDATFKKMSKDSRIITLTVKDVASKMDTDSVSKFKQASKDNLTSTKDFINKQFTKTLRSKDLKASDTNTAALVAKTIFITNLAQIIQDLETGK